MAGIMRLAERPAREVMTPRTELHWIERRAPEVEIRTAIDQSPHSLMLVCDGEVDKVVGVVKVRDLQAVLLRGRKIQLTRMMKKPAIVPDQIGAMDALRVLQTADIALVLVHDEYGHLDGIVTPGSILAALGGTFAHDVEHGEEPPLVERDDGSWLVSGAASADVLSDRLGMHMPNDRDYSTVAGFALSVLKHLPETGETFRHDGWSFEIVDMDGRKIDKLIASRPKGAPAGAPLDSVA
jgi:putative hemolysin